MEERERRPWAWILVLCAALLALDLWQGKRISDLEQDIWNAQDSVMDSVSRVDQRLASLRSELESAGDLVRGWSYTTSVDGHWLLIDVSVTLKEWRADTVVELLWTDEGGDGGEGYVPLLGDGVGSFTGTLERPLPELSGGYSLDVKIVNGDTQRRESLGWLGDSASLLPLQCNAWGAGGPQYRDGVFTLGHVEAELSGNAGDVPEGIRDAVFRLKQNGEVVVEEAAMQGERMGSFTCDEEWSVECRPGDEVALTFSCRDGSGLGYEFFLNGWRIAGEGGLENIAPETGWPKLTWD